MDAGTRIACLLQNFAITLKGNPGLMGVWSDSSQEVLQRHTAPRWANLPHTSPRPHTEVTPVLVTVVYMSMLSDFEIPMPAPRPDHIRRECIAAGECADVPCCQHVIAQTRTLVSHVCVRLKLHRGGIEK